MIGQDRFVIGYAVVTLCANVLCESVLADEPTPAANEAVELFAPIFDVGILVTDESIHTSLSGLMRAVAIGDLAEIDRLVQEGADIDAQDINGRTALSNAAGIGSLAVVERLLLHGADPDIVARDGRTALAYAIREGNEAMIGALLRGGSSPNQIVHRGGQSLLSHAAVTNQITTVDALLAADVELEVEGVMALNNAIWKGNDEIVAKLLEQDFDVNVPAQNRQTVLHTAAEKGALDVVQLLLEKGADIHATNRYGQTPLSLAIARKQSHVAERLVAEEQIASASDLMAAASSGQPAVTLALLEKSDFRSLSEGQVNDILVAAEANYDSQVMDRLLQASLNGDPVGEMPDFVFVRSNQDACRVDRWEMTSDELVSLYAEKGPCLQSYYIEDTTRSLFVVDGADVEAISIDDGRVLFTETFPMALVAETAAALTRSWEEWLGEGMAFDAILQIRSVGYTADGDLGFNASATGPADGWYSYLFVRSNGEWRLADQKNCHRFAGSCPFTTLAGQEIGDRDARFSIWHPRVRLNPHFAGKHSISDSEQQQGGRIWSGAVRFEIAGNEMTVFHDAQVGEHCDEDCTYVLTLGLGGDARSTEIISDYAFAHAIVGSYLLVRPSRTEAFQLIDLRSRDEIFGNIRSGSWLYK